MRFFITFSYDGTRYHGWQRQPNGITVQERLEEALSAVLRAPIEVTGAGRTDTGVHASMMVAHFDLQPALMENVAPTPERFPQQLAYRLNRILPSEIGRAHV